jgi:hypothetical protein
MHVSFNFVGSGWIFQYVFLQSCMCLQIPILRHPVVTREIHSYLQNSNSTFFLIYADDYRQHTSSPPFTYCSLIKTQPKHSTLPFSSSTDQSRPLPFFSHRHRSWMVTEKRRAQTCKTMVLRNRYIWAKNKARLMVIQLTEMPGHDDCAICPSKIHYAPNSYGSPTWGLYYTIKDLWQRSGQTSFIKYSTA